MTSMAFEITVEDVINALAHVNLSREIAEKIYDSLDFGSIELAALYGDDLDEQTDLAHVEIKKQVVDNDLLRKLS